ncbi:MAG: glycosyl transferase [Verrucomicrobiae bacterium]|nr:glycosyl transferase [Verrucomicrobiae bacterium]
MRRVRSLLAQCTPLKSTWHGARFAFFRVLLGISPVLLSQVRFRLAWKRWPDFRRPKTFDEKLLWLNLYWRHPLKPVCGDKYTLRGYVEGQGLGHLLPYLYGVYESVEEIDFRALPESGVLKCSHGCKCNIFWRQKINLDVNAARRDLARWMRTDYSRFFGELHYAEMKPRIICEELLNDGRGELPVDYKLYCFNGSVKCTLVCVGRQPNGKGKVYFYDNDWHYLRYIKHEGPPVYNIEPPSSYTAMIVAAEKLARPFPFVRVDFYDIGGRPVLGEMTFTDSACINAGLTEEAQYELGANLALPFNSVL